MNAYSRIEWRSITAAAFPFAVIAFCIGTFTSETRAESEPIQPKIIEIYYDENDNVTQTPRIAESDESNINSANTGTGAVVVRPSGFLKTVDVDDIERMVRYRFGNATLLIFYAAYCPACHDFLPVAAQLAQKWRNKGLSVVAISLDPEPNTFRMYARHFVDNIEIFRLRAYQSKELSVQAGRLGMSVINEQYRIPAFAVFDREGLLVVEKVGGAPFEKLDLAIGRLLNEPTVCTNDGQNG